MTTFHFQNSLHQPSETRQAWIIRITSHWLCTEPNHPEADMIASWQPGEDQIVSAWTGQRYVLLLQPPSAFRTRAVSTARIPPFHLRNDDDEWVSSERTDGVFAVPDHFASYEAAYNSAIVTAAALGTEISIVNGFGNCCEQVDSDTLADLHPLKPA